MAIKLQKLCQAGCPGILPTNTVTNNPFWHSLSSLSPDPAWNGVAELPRVALSLLASRFMAMQAVTLLIRPLYRTTIGGCKQTS